MRAMRAARERSTNAPLFRRCGGGPCACAPPPYLPHDRPRSGGLGRASERRSRNLRNAGAERTRERPTIPVPEVPSGASTLWQSPRAHAGTRARPPYLPHGSARFGGRVRGSEGHRGSALTRAPNEPETLRAVASALHHPVGSRRIRLPGTTAPALVLGTIRVDPPAVLSYDPIRDGQSLRSCDRRRFARPA
jgi:hypothetical protein